MPRPTAAPANSSQPLKRSPAEYAESYLEGAELLDLSGDSLSRSTRSGSEFAEALPALDPDNKHLASRRSGNRAVMTVQMTDDAGITDVTDLGSVANAASTTGASIARSLQPR